MIDMNRPLIDSTRRLLMFTLVCSASNMAAWATDREAAERVREGVRHHQAGDYEQAAKAFSEAAVSLPENPRIAFNQGCALAAQGKHDEAESLLRDAALAPEPDLAADAYYNLGCLAAEKMKALFGNQPEEAVDETREKGLLQVRTAVDHYRNALRANSEHDAARRNLELLRIWSKHIQDRWAQRDRERRREQMDLLQFLDWLQTEQRGLRSSAKTLPVPLETPTQRQMARKLSTAQRELLLEIEPLKGKLDQALQPPPDPNAPGAQPPQANPPASNPTALSPEMQQARQALHGLADQAGEAMTRAAEALANRKLPSAVAAQTEALPPLNQLFEFVAPFEAILQEAIKKETALVESSNQALEEGASISSSVGTTPEHEEAAETQRFVSGWARMLMRKAEQLLSEAAASSSPGEADADDSSPTEIPLPTSTARPAGNSPSDTPPSDVAPNDAPRSDVPTNDLPPKDVPTSDVPTSDVPTSDVPTSDVPTEDRSANGSAATDMDAKTEPAASSADPQAAYEKAVELGPRIVTLTREAADDLLRKSWSDALPKQEESLKLLKEIAALLPPQEPQDDQEQQDQDKQDQDKQDQEQQDKKEQDQKQQDEKQQDEKQNQSSDDEQKKQEDDQSESKQQDDQKKQKSDEEKSKQENSQKQQQQELSRQQAESLLRQVREREREHREFEKEIRRLLRSRIIVERDW